MLIRYYRQNYLIGLDKVKFLMKIIYIANSIVPSTSANSIHVMKMCEAFTINNIDIELILPNFQEHGLMNDEYVFYGIKNKFKITRNRLVNKSPNGFLNYIFSLTSVVYAIFIGCDLIFTRNPLVSFFCIIFGRKHILEMHDRVASVSRLLSKLLKLLKLFNSNKLLQLIVISKPLQDLYLNEFSIKHDKIIVLPDGVTYENFIKVNQRSFFTDKNIQIGYFGSLWPGKGIDKIISLANIYQNCNFNIYGANEKQIKDYKDKISSFGINNITFFGYLPNKNIPKQMCKHDILLMPNQTKMFTRGSKSNIADFTSPLKMFEYMASGRIIVSSDLLVLREVLNETNSFLVVPDNLQQWIETIEYIILNKDIAIKRASQAKKDVMAYTWDVRVKKILGVLNVKYKN